MYTTHTYRLERLPAINNNILYNYLNTHNSYNRRPKYNINMYIVFIYICTYLLVIQFSGQGESSGVRVDVEHVIGPIAYHRVRDHAVDALVLVRGQYVADFHAPRRGLANVQRIHAFRERRRVVVGVENLYIYTRAVLILSYYYSIPARSRTWEKFRGEGGGRFKTNVKYP